MQRTLSLADALSGELAHTLLAVSHRWECEERVGAAGVGLPDPEGEHLKAIVEHLDAHPEVELLYYDYTCSEPPPPTPEPLSADPSTAYASSEAFGGSQPPPSRGSQPPPSRGSQASSAAAPTPPPAVAPDAALDAAAAEGAPSAADALAPATPAASEGPTHDALCASRLPFLCGRCLLLVDAGYSSRFASQLEAWLSMQLTTADGFVESPAHERCAIRLLRDEPSFMQTLLVESWRGKALKQACEMLATAEGVEEADGHAQLERLRMWDRWLRAQSAIEGTDA